VGAELLHAGRRDEANSHSAAILRTGLKIRHPLSFNWPVSEARGFSTNWTTADETQRLFLHQRITLCRKRFAYFINHAECGTVKADSHIACRAHAVPLIHTCHTAPLPCSDSLKECHPRCVYQNYSRSKIREVAVKNTTMFVGTIIYQLHVSALVGHLQVGIRQRKISIIIIGMGGRDLVYKYMGFVVESVLEQACKRNLVPPYLYL